MENELNQHSNGEGLEKVKRRLSSDLVEQKIAALAEALNYGQAGLNLVIEVLKDPSSPIQSVAYLLLKERAEQEVKEALEYYEEKIKAHERYQEFVINVVGELRTPINGIIGFQKLLVEGVADDPEEERHFLEEVYRLALNLHKRLNDIQDFAKIEADQMDLTLGEIKLDELFKDVENFARILVEKKNLSLSLKTPTNHHKIILYGDYKQLLRVISNLVDNAIKFTGEGRIKITAEVINKKAYIGSQEFVNMVKIEVIDMGIGVLPNAQNRLFIPFFDSGNHEITNHISRGFKLALSKKLVEKMGGEMSFYSAGENMGSTVTFTIPMSFSA
ncbi:MAG: HAMP domain-containing sensor histidine kinase [Coleofasciculaceae cyanobacterium]